jgi:hypothetical protein
VAAVAQGHRVVGVERQRAAVGGERVVVPAQPRQGAPAADVRVRAAGVRRNRPVVCRERLLVLVPVEERGGFGERAARAEEDTSDSQSP